jgi:hypothetical protein
MTNTETNVHIVTVAVRDANRVVVEINTLCGQTIAGKNLPVGKTTCATCLRFDAL